MTLGPLTKRATALGLVVLSLLNNTVFAHSLEVNTLAHLTPFGSIRTATPHLASAPHVLLIEDVHLNSEAQQNISKTITDLLRQQKVDLVALEGAFDDFSLEPFNHYPYRQDIEDVADVLLTHNKISGAVHALLKAGNDSYVGIDDPNHHAANVAAYRHAVGALPQVAIYLSEKRRLNEQRVATIFNPDLRTFESMADAFEAKQISLGDYLLGLKKRFQSADESLDVIAFLEAFQLERRLDPAKMTEEKRRYLAAEGREPISRYPHLNDYVQYVQLSQSIDGEKLLAGISAFEDSIRVRLARQKSERELLREIDRLKLEEKISRFALSKSEWIAYKSVPHERLFESFENFYREAERRDQFMAARLLARIKERQAKYPVVVVGGFHRAGIMDALRQAHCSVSVFVPTITKMESSGATTYLTVFSEEKAPLEKLFEGEKLFLNPVQMDDGVRQAATHMSLALTALRHGERAAKEISDAAVGATMRLKEVSFTSDGAHLAYGGASGEKKAYVPMKDGKILDVPQTEPTYQSTPGAMGFWSRWAWGQRLPTVGRVEGALTALGTVFLTWGGMAFFHTFLLQSISGHHGLFTFAVRISLIAAAAYVLNIGVFFPIFYVGHLKTGILRPNFKVNTEPTKMEVLFASIRALRGVSTLPLTMVAVTLLEFSGNNVSTDALRLFWTLALVLIAFSIYHASELHGNFNAQLFENYRRTRQDVITPLNPIERKTVHMVGRRLASYVSTSELETTPGSRVIDAHGPDEVVPDVDVFMILGSHFLSVPRVAAQVYENHLRKLNIRWSVLKPFPIPVYFSGGRGGRNSSQLTSEAETFRAIFLERVCDIRRQEFSDKIEKYGYILSAVPFGRTAHHFLVACYQFYLSVATARMSGLEIEPNSENTGANIKMTEEKWAQQKFAPKKILATTEPRFQLRLRQTWLQQSRFKDDPSVKLVSYQLYPFTFEKPDREDLEDGDRALIETAAELWYQLTQFDAYSKRAIPFVVRPEGLDSMLEISDALVEILAKRANQISGVQQNFPELINEARHRIITQPNRAPTAGALLAWKRFSWGRDVGKVGMVEGILLSVACQLFLLVLFSLKAEAIHSDILRTVTGVTPALWVATAFSFTFLLSTLPLAFLMWALHYFNGVLRVDGTEERKPGAVESFLLAAAAYSSHSGFIFQFVGTLLIAQLKLSADPANELGAVMGLLCVMVGILLGGIEHYRTNQKIKSNYLLNPNRDIDERLNFPPNVRGKLARFVNYLSSYVQMDRTNGFFKEKNVRDLGPDDPPELNVDVVLIIGSESSLVPRLAAANYEKQLKAQNLRSSFLNPFPIPVYIAGGLDPTNQLRLSEAEVYREKFVQEIGRLRRQEFADRMRPHLMPMFPMGLLLSELPLLVFNVITFLSTSKPGAITLETKSGNIGDKIEFTEALWARRRFYPKKILIMSSPELRLRVRQTWLQLSRMAKDPNVTLVNAYMYSKKVDGSMSDADLLRFALSIWHQIDRLFRFSHPTLDRRQFIKPPYKLKYYASKNAALQDMISPYREHSGLSPDVAHMMQKVPMPVRTPGALGFWPMLGVHDLRIIGALEGALAAVAPAILISQGFFWSAGITVLLSMISLFALHKRFGIVFANGVIQAVTNRQALRATVIASSAFAALTFAQDNAALSILVGALLHAALNARASEKSEFIDMQLRNVGAGLSTLSLKGNATLASPSIGIFHVRSSAEMATSERVLSEWRPDTTSPLIIICGKNLNPQAVEKLRKFSEGKFVTIVSENELLLDARTASYHYEDVFEFPSVRRFAAVETLVSSGYKAGRVVILSSGSLNFDAGAALRSILSAFTAVGDLWVKQSLETILRAAKATARNA